MTGVVAPALRSLADSRRIVSHRAFDHWGNVAAETTRRAVVPANGANLDFVNLCGARDERNLLLKITFTSALVSAWQILATIRQIRPLILSIYRRRPMPFSRRNHPPPISPLQHLRSPPVPALDIDPPQFKPPFLLPQIQLHLSAFREIKRVPAITK